MRAHECGQRLRVALHALELGHAAKVAFPDAAARRVGEIGVANRILVVDLVEDAVVGDQILDRRAGQVVGVELLGEVVELQRHARAAR